MDNIVIGRHPGVGPTFNGAPSGTYRSAVALRCWLIARWIVPLKGVDLCIPMTHDSNSKCLNAMVCVRSAAVTFDLKGMFTDQDVHEHYQLPSALDCGSNTLDKDNGAVSTTVCVSILSAARQVQCGVDQPSSEAHGKHQEMPDIHHRQVLLDLRR